MGLRRGKVARALMILGLSIALVSALGTNVSALFKARGAGLARPVRIRHPLRSAICLFRSRWFAIGWLLSLVAWGLHVQALSLAPLSTVQAILSGGLVFLAVLAERFFGFQLGRRQWTGVIITATGLVMLGLTSKTGAYQGVSLPALVAVEAGILALGAALVWISTRHAVDTQPEAFLLATAAGILFGLSDVSIKYLTHAPGPLFGLLSPWTLTAVLAFVISFYASARSLQLAAPVEVIAVTSVAANLAAILGGILVFGEPIGAGPVGVTAHLLAFCLVIAGAGVMPSPARAITDQHARGVKASAEG